MICLKLKYVKLGNPWESTIFQSHPKKNRSPHLWTLQLRTPRLREGQQLLHQEIEGLPVHGARRGLVPGNFDGKCRVSPMENEV